MSSHLHFSSCNFLAALLLDLPFHTADSVSPLLTNELTKNSEGLYKSYYQFWNKFSCL